MARQEVIKVRCDRCKREELQPVGAPKTQSDFQSQYKGKTLSYEDLCYRCIETIDNAMERIKEWEREIHPAHGPVVQPNLAPPVTSAPDYTPPKPHSAAALKK